MQTFWRVFYHKLVWKFVKSFLCIYSDDYMVLIFQFINMVYHIEWFACIEESLHPWDKAHLILMCDLFNVLLNSVFRILLKIFASNIHQWYWIGIFFFCDIFVCFLCQSDGGLMEWVWKFSFLCNFLKESEQDRYSLFYKLLVKFTCETMGS